VENYVAIGRIAFAARAIPPSIVISSQSLVNTHLDGVHLLLIAAVQVATVMIEFPQRAAYMLVACQQSVSAESTFQRRPRHVTLQTVIVQ